MQGDIRILVVDDSEFFAQMTADTLAEEHDMRTFAVSDPKAGLDVLEAQSIDCIVSDYQMPEMNGLEFHSAVTERYPHIPFILLTGRGDEEIASDAISAGVADYILKLEVVEDQQYQRLANRIRNTVSETKTNQKYERLLANTPDAIVQIDEDGVILAANRAAVALYGEDTADLVGESITDALGDRGKERLEVAQAVIEADDTRRVEDEYCDCFFENIYVPVDMPGGSAAVQIISRDITERKERERELERQNEKLEEFASVVSHDLRNPLNIAASYLELYQDKGDEAFLDKIENAHRRMEDIIESLLSLARKSQPVEQTQKLDLSVMADDASSRIDMESATVEVETDRLIRGNPDRVLELFIRLFENSVEHTDGDVTITVDTIDERGFYVEDDGTGIPDDEKADVFDIGYGTGEGEGFGIPIVQGMANAHEWEVELTDSEAGGVRFEFRNVVID